MESGSLVLVSSLLKLTMIYTVNVSEHCDLHYLHAIDTVVNNEML